MLEGVNNINITGCLGLNSNDDDSSDDDYSDHEGVFLRYSEYMI